MELEKKRKEEILIKLKSDHELSKEILAIMRNSNPGNKKTIKSTGLTTSSSRQMVCDIFCKLL